MWFHTSSLEIALYYTFQYNINQTKNNTVSTYHHLFSLKSYVQDKTKYGRLSISHLFEWCLSWHRLSEEKMNIQGLHFHQACLRTILHQRQLNYSLSQTTQLLRNSCLKIRKKQMHKCGLMILALIETFETLLHYNEDLSFHIMLYRMRLLLFRG